MLEILPPGGLPPLSSGEIHNRATSVDFVTDAAFIEVSRKAELPKPKVRVQPRSNTYTSMLARQLPLDYDGSVDGRIVAIRFVDHLVEMTDKNYHIARPEDLGAAGFLFYEIQRLSGRKHPPEETRLKLIDLKQKLGHLNEYAEGRLRVVNRDGELRYYVTGAVPKTNSVLITVPFGVNGQGHSAIYRSFLDKLGK